MRKNEFLNDPSKLENVDFKSDILKKRRFCMYQANAFNNSLSTDVI